MPRGDMIHNASHPAEAVANGDDTPVDLVHLARQTMADTDLEQDVLGMFVCQARQALEQMTDVDAARISAAAHRLKGAAAAIGAFRVSAAAERLEAEPGDARLQTAVGAAVAEAEKFILERARRIARAPQDQPASPPCVD